MLLICIGNGCDKTQNELPDNGNDISTEQGENGNEEVTTGVQFDAGAGVLFAFISV